MAFFSKYAGELRRAGIRSVDDIKREFCSVQLIVDMLKASANPSEPEPSFEDNQREVVEQVKKLLRSTSTHEAKVAEDKAARQAAKKKSKLKGFSSSKADKEKDKKEKKDKKDKKAGKESQPAVVASNDKKESKSQESSFPEANSSTDQDGGFEVQKLNMSDFLGA